MEAHITPNTETRKIYKRVCLAEKITMNHPFNCIVAGPTMSGKSTWVRNLLKSAIITPQPTRIYWCYGEWQPFYEEIDNVEFIEGLPDFVLLKNAEPKLLIIDDLMQELKSDKRLIQLFTKGSHHWNLSCIHIVQNLFFEGLRTCRINAQYIILMNNPCDQLQIRNLGKQIFPGQLKYFMSSYLDATSEPFGYLFIDLTQQTKPQMRLQTNIFTRRVFYCPPKSI